MEAASTDQPFGEFFFFSQEEQTNGRIAGGECGFQEKF